MYCLFSIDVGKEMRRFINTVSSEINLEIGLSLMGLLGNAILLELVAYM